MQQASLGNYCCSPRKLGVLKNRPRILLDLDSDYEKVELLRHREDWFLNPTPQAITIAIEQAKKRNNEEQVKALTAFLQQISSQRPSTDSKEAKDQKS